MERPLVGVGVLIFDEDDRVLLGLRKGKHAEGMWGLPGGHLEGGESFEQCAKREVEEETGILLPDDILYWTTVNTVYHTEGKHYVVILMVVRCPNGQDAEIVEPKKCEEWVWASWDDMPGPLMPGLETAIRNGTCPVDMV